MEYPDEWAPLLKIYQKFPMKELIIHPRLQKEGYKGTPHLEAFAEAVEALQCPLCYNGDIPLRRHSRTSWKNCPWSILS